MDPQHALQVALVEPAFDTTGDSSHGQAGQELEVVCGCRRHDVWWKEAMEITTSYGFGVEGRRRDAYEGPKIELNGL